MADWLVFEQGDLIELPRRTVTPPKPTVVTQLPVPITDWIAFELPYHISHTSSEVGVLAVRPDDKQLSYEVVLNGVRQPVSGQFLAAPMQLNGRLPIEAQTALLTGTPRGNLLLVDDEFLLLDGDRVQRGVLDTLPAEHADGAKVWDTGLLWVSDRGAAASNTISQTVATLSNTATSSFPYDPANNVVVDLRNRQGRPLPAANIKLNGEYYPDELEDDIVITYAGRNRRTQRENDRLTGFYNEIGQLPEQGVRLAVRISPSLVANPAIGGVAKQKAFQATNGSLTVSKAEILAALGGSIVSELVVNVWTENANGLASRYTWTHIVQWQAILGHVLQFRPASAAAVLQRHVLQFELLPEPEVPPETVKQRHVLQFSDLLNPITTQFHVLQFERSPEDGWGYNWGNIWGN